MACFSPAAFASSASPICSWVFLIEGDEELPECRSDGRVEAADRSEVEQPDSAVVEG